MGSGLLRHAEDKLRGNGFYDTIVLLVGYDISLLTLIASMGRGFLSHPCRCPWAG